MASGLDILETIDKIEAVLNAVVWFDLILDQSSAQIKLLFLRLANHVGFHWLCDYFVSGLKIG
jgi:hypothetical protein